jgi:(p)ppGpp synthase/HD superfamily hydrolase
MSSMIHKALAIAFDAHNGVYRKSSLIPYLVHPMRVADMVSESKSDILISAALLHDVLEDAPSDRLPEFIERIGSLSTHVLSIVTELTRSDPQSTDKAAYLATFGSKSLNALMIKIADRYDNVMDFKRHGSNYAPKYARKATELLNAADSRKGEILEYDEPLYHTLMGMVNRIRIIGNPDTI